MAQAWDPSTSELNSKRISKLEVSLGKFYFTTGKRGKNKKRKKRNLSLFLSR